MDEAEYYKMAEVEDRMWYYRSLHGHCARLLAAHLGRRSATVLDAGCGTGGMIRHLESMLPAARLTGLDFSPLACRLARSRVRAPIVEGSVTAMPFEFFKPFDVPFKRFSPGAGPRSADGIGGGNQRSIWIVGRYVPVMSLYGI